MLFPETLTRNIVVSVLVVPILSCSSDSIEDLGAGYIWVSESACDNLIVPHPHRAGEPYIPSNVEAFAVDDQHIIARQKVTKRDLHSGINPLVNLAGKELFWIIHKRDNEIEGPLNMNRFEERLSTIGASLQSSDLRDTGLGDRDHCYEPKR